MTRTGAVADLVERYLYAVEQELPRGLRADVTAELRSLIEDALQDRARGLGREVDRTLTADVLLEMGAPSEVARRYRSGVQSLIGPQTYPLFVRVLKLVLAGLAGLVLLVTVVQQVFSAAPAGLLSLAILGRLVGLYFQMAVVFFAVTVIVFALVERGILPQPERDRAWDPRDLPEPPEPGNDHAIHPGISVRLALAIALLALLIFFPERLGFVMWDAQRRMTFVPFADVGLYLPVWWLGLWCAAGIVLSAVVLRQRRWTAPARWADVGLSLFGAAVLLELASGSALHAPAAAPGLAVLVKPLGMLLYLLPLALGFGALVQAFELLTRRRPAGPGTDR